MDMNVKLRTTTILLIIIQIIIHLFVLSEVLWVNTLTGVARAQGEFVLVYLEFGKIISIAAIITLLIMLINSIVKKEIKDNLIYIFINIIIIISPFISIEIFWNILI